MKSPWKGKTVLITSGPTREYLDPIRFMTNASTGLMGWALASEARRLGARTVVVSGPSAVPPPRGVSVVPVVTARQMHRAVLRLSRGADVVVAAAAVSDWRFSAASRHKIKRTSRPLRLTLIPNPDIIKDVSRRRGRASRPVLVGFALETRDLLSAARRKLRSKGLDLIVANSASALAEPDSRVAIVSRDGRARRWTARPKAQTARAIFQEIERIL